MVINGDHTPSCFQINIGLAPRDALHSDFGIWLLAPSVPILTHWQMSKAIISNGFEPSRVGFTLATTPQ
jgi:hypothetical protein